MEYLIFPLSTDPDFFKNIIFFYTYIEKSFPDNNSYPYVAETDRKEIRQNYGSAPLGENQI